MSFTVNWNTLETDSMRNWTSELLTGALNSGKRPNILASDVTIKDLNFGKIAPNFEILEIGELEQDRFRGIFKITYSGDFHLTLHTQVQANPLKIYSDNSREQEISEDSCFVTPEFLSSADPFNIPLDLKLSDVKISGIGIIVFSKSKGLTLVFRNDPLDSIKVSSTFDTVQVLSNFLQKQIETQIRDLFRESLPTLIHKFSLKYTSTFKKNDFMNNLKAHLRDQTSQNTIDSLELERISPNNLKKLATLFDSRETLDLKIPKFKKVVQRNNLEKFNKNHFPSLSTSLYSNLNIPPVSGLAHQSNSIPVELLVNDDYNQVDNILKEISSIQTKSFRSGNNETKRPKRRTIKLGKYSQRKPENQTTSSMPTSMVPEGSSEASVSISHSASVKSSEMSEALSGSTTVLDEQGGVMYQPTPIKVSNDVGPDPLPMLEFKTDLFGGDADRCPSPLSSSSSFVGGVGLGHSYLNLSSGNGIRGSPLATEAMKLPTREEKTVKIKKSMNRVDIDLINEKLQMKLGFDRANEATKREEISNMKKTLDSCFDLPPPPYYQAPRTGY